jgi:8-oxo-dGTP pyrophosphatase MutT (NUDIX family)
MTKIIIASGPVIVEDHKVLLAIQGEDTFWKFCGGKTKDSETLQDTAQRRSREELGIEIKILDKNPFLLHTIKKTPEGNIDVILVHYLAKRIGEINPGSDIREWKWLPLEDLKNKNIAPNIIPALTHFKLI